MTHPHVPPDASPHDGGFLRVFFGSFAALLALLAALALLTDPLGGFGTGLVPPVVSSDRDQKAARYRRLPLAPELVVLGSSRSKTIAPFCLTQSPTGAGFNFAVNGAGTEDLVAVLGFLRAEPGFRVRTMIVGVDPEMLQGRGGADRALESSRALARFAPRQRGRVGSLGADLFGWQAVAAALRSIVLHMVSHDSTPETLLGADGVQRYPRAESVLSHAPDAMQPQVLGSIPGILARYESFSGLDSERTADLSDFAREAHAAGIEVVAFIPPVHPALARAAAGTAWRPRTEETVALLRGLEGEGVLRYVETRQLLDASRDTTQFVDAIHFLAPAAATLAGALSGGRGRCAVQ